MKVRVFKIKNPDSCISAIIEVKSDTPTDTLTHYVPPFGSPEIILYLGQTHQIKNVIFANGFIKGIYNTTQKIDFIPNYHFLSIRLQPYGLKQIFNIKATALINSVIDIQNHPIANTFLDLLKSSEYIDVSSLKALVSSMELYDVHPVSSSTKAFIKLVSATDYNTIKDLIFQSGIGLRTLQRNFKNEVGLSPKKYLRIKRLNAIEQKMSQHVDVFDIIADFDFTDQAHFIKDFKQLRNVTPKEILTKKLLLSDQLAIPEITMI
jgi:AraC-like DNA-binding protein